MIEHRHNKALQIDNLRGVACVHARCAPILAHKRHRINCDRTWRYVKKHDRK